MRVLALLCLLIIIGCDSKTKTITEIVIQDPPEPISLPINVNVEANVVSGSFLFDGQPAIANPYVRANYSLTSDNSTELSLLGESNDLTFEVMIVNGTYQLIYDHQQGPQLPSNTAAVISSNFEVTSDNAQNIDLTTATVRTSFTLNNGPFPSTIYDKGVFYLKPVDGDQLIELGHSDRENDPVVVLPGTYHVIWDYIQGWTVPVNKMTRIMSDVVIQSTTALDINVESIASRVAFTLNGQAFPNSPYERSHFYLTRDSGAEAFIGSSLGENEVVNVIPGIYDIEYRNIDSLSITPINKKAVVQQDYNVSGAIDVDVQSIQLSLNSTLNGEAFPENIYRDGVIELYDLETDSYDYIGKTYDDVESLSIVSGTYDIAYSHEDGNEVPQNHRAIVASAVNLTSNEQIDLDIMGVNLTGNITVDGAAFPVNQYDFANIILRGTNSEEDIILFTSYAQQEPIMVLPGTYDVYYSCQVCTNIPFNTEARILENIQVNSDTEVAIDLESVRIEVFKTLNGGDFPQSIYQSGNLWGGLGENDRVDMGRTVNSQPNIIVIAGDYFFWYQVVNNLSNAVPINEWVLVDQQAVTN